MTVKKLKEQLAILPDHMDVCFDISDVDPEDEFTIQSINKAEVRSVRYWEEGNEPGEDPEAYVDSFVLSIEI